MTVISHRSDSDFNLSLSRSLTFHQPPYYIQQQYPNDPVGSSSSHQVVLLRTLNAKALPSFILSPEVRRGAAPWDFQAPAHECRVTPADPHPHRERAAATRPERTGPEAPTAAWYEHAHTHAHTDASFYRTRLAGVSTP